MRDAATPLSHDAADGIPLRRFTVRDIELIAVLGAIWVGAFALNWWHVIP